MPRRVTRRTFVQTTTAAGAALLLPRNVFGANEKLNVAVVGTAGRAGENMEAVSRENVVAICDVDERNLDKAATRAEGVAKAKKFVDFRKMLEELGDQIDAVVVGTPDHTHAPAAMMAMRMGKHVYCEKPLAHNVREVRLMRDTAKQKKLATQMGTQIHAGENYRRVVELVRAGAIGKVTRAHNWVPTSYSGSQKNVKRPEGTPPVPQGLHWDLWLGPAPERPYHPDYHPFWWRGWWDFANGALGDMACHHMDLPHWALDLREPLTVQSNGPEPDPEVAPAWQVVDYHYPARGEQPPVHLTWYHGGKQPAELEEIEAKQAEAKADAKPQAEGRARPRPQRWGAGTLLVGDKGMILADYDKHVLLPEDKFKDFQRPDKSIPKSPGHHAEWVKACKEGTPTTCNFDYSGALAEAVLLGCVAHKAGKRIEWDAKAMRIKNAPDAERFLTREYRKGWEIEGIA